MRHPHRLPLILLAALAAAPAQAGDYQASKDSTLGFIARYDGEGFEGRFGRFSARVRFDPGALAQCRFEVSIPLASVSTRQGERDDVLKGAEFFNIAKQAEATYIAERCRRLSADKFAADGWLNLNGQRKYVQLSFTWTPGPSPVLAGEAIVKRLDFNVGIGDWADTELMPNEIKVRTRLQLQPAAAAAAAKN